ncbi:anti-sigma factor [Corallococcus sp. Z5C101001]|uniref:anti-sigma factor family protein n=1 Tax=Corallococcus sp. Z5C101001 TaxID=2596829 RepID=UPI001180D685|nr:zf-HC2 domain-containing protein [Corallococcus sp. Z5C101001]TSC22760.1 transmembrane transcriptional regulator [Corallococcus sp. Z5C101001]
MNGLGRRGTDVEPRLDHLQTKALFLALVDEALPAPQEQAVRSHLDGCEECRQGWDQYARTVERVRTVEREKAPPALASLIAGRVRRQRRFGLRGLHLAHAHHRFPVEVLIPLLLAAAVAAFLLMSS